MGCGGRVLESCLLAQRAVLWDAPSSLLDAVVEATDDEEEISGSYCLSAVAPYLILIRVSNA